VDESREKLRNIGFTEGFIPPSVLVTIYGVRIGARFHDHLKVVTTNNYNTIADFHTKSSQSSFTSPCLVTHLNNGYSSAVFSLDVSW
jgi:hypothetical protein